MLAAQRRSAILDIVRCAGAAQCGDLVSQFGVSAMTIRRDIEALARRGLLSKVRGGAMVAAADVAVGTTSATRSVRHWAEREAIAAHAASMVAPGTTVSVSAGTTTAALAQHLIDVPGLTVVTNSLTVASVFRRSDNLARTVVLTGGIRTPSGALAGPVAEAALAALNVDLCFLDVYGFSHRTGFTASDLLEAAVNRRLVASARRVVVLADHTKWERVGIATIAALGEADTLVTDSGLVKSAVVVLSEQVGELVVVPV